MLRHRSSPRSSLSTQDNGNVTKSALRSCLAFCVAMVIEICGQANPCVTLVQLPEGALPDALPGERQFPELCVLIRLRRRPLYLHQHVHVSSPAA